MKIIKCYFDIGCVYEGDKTIEDAFNDYQNWNIKYGMIGVLKLEIDTIRKTKTEISFEQIIGPTVYVYSEYMLLSLIDSRYRMYENIDMIVGWNSRDFDIPIIVNNTRGIEKFKEHCIKKIVVRDRDLLDLCILREIDIRGGLEAVIKRMKINHNFQHKNIPVYNDREICFLTEFDKCTNRFNTNLKAIKQRNEFDVRILPLLEEKLGYLYEPRLPMDKFHKKW